MHPLPPHQEEYLHTVKHVAEPQQGSQQQISPTRLLAEQRCAHLPLHAQQQVLQQIHIPSQHRLRTPLQQQQHGQNPLQHQPPEPEHRRLQQQCASKPFLQEPQLGQQGQEMRERIRFSPLLPSQSTGARPSQTLEQFVLQTPFLKQQQQQQIPLCPLQPVRHLIGMQSEPHGPLQQQQEPHRAQPHLQQAQPHHDGHHLRVNQEPVSRLLHNKSLSGAHMWQQQQQHRTEEPNEQRQHLQQQLPNNTSAAAMSSYFPACERLSRAQLSQQQQLQYQWQLLHQTQATRYSPPTQQNSCLAEHQQQVKQQLSCSSFARAPLTGCRASILCAPAVASNPRPPPPPSLTSKPSLPLPFTFSAHIPSLPLKNKQKGVVTPSAAVSSHTTATPAEASLASALSGKAAVSSAAAESLRDFELRDPSASNARTTLAAFGGTSAITSSSSDTDARNIEVKNLIDGVVLTVSTAAVPKKGTELIRNKEAPVAGNTSLYSAAHVLSADVIACSENDDKAKQGERGEDATEEATPDTPCILPGACSGDAASRKRLPLTPLSSGADALVAKERARKLLNDCTFPCPAGHDGLGSTAASARAPARISIPAAPMLTLAMYGSSKTSALVPLATAARTKPSASSCPTPVTPENAAAPATSPVRGPPPPGVIPLEAREVRAANTVEHGLASLKTAGGLTNGPPAETPLPVSAAAATLPALGLKTISEAVTATCQPTDTTALLAAAVESTATAAPATLAPVTVRTLADYSASVIRRQAERFNGGEQRQQPDAQKHTSIMPATEKLPHREPLGPRVKLSHTVFPKSATCKPDYILSSIALLREPLLQSRIEEDDTASSSAEAAGLTVLQAREYEKQKDHRVPTYATSLQYGADRTCTAVYAPYCEVALPPGLDALFCRSSNTSGITGSDGMVDLWCFDVDDAFPLIQGLRAEESKHPGHEKLQIQPSDQHKQREQPVPQALDHKAQSQNDFQRQQISKLSPKKIQQHEHEQEWVPFPQQQDYAQGLFCASCNFLREGATTYPDSRCEESGSSHRDSVSNMSNKERRLRSTAQVLTKAKKKADSQEASPTKAPLQEKPVEPQGHEIAEAFFEGSGIAAGETVARRKGEHSEENRENVSAFVGVASDRISGITNINGGTKPEGQEPAAIAAAGAYKGCFQYQKQGAGFMQSAYPDQEEKVDVRRDALPEQLVEISISGTASSTALGPVNSKESEWASIDTRRRRSRSRARQSQQREHEQHQLPDRRDTRATEAVHTMHHRYWNYCNGGTFSSRNAPTRDHLHLPREEKSIASVGNNSRYKSSGSEDSEYHCCRGGYRELLRDTEHVKLQDDSQQLYQRQLPEHTYCHCDQISLRRQHRYSWQQSKSSRMGMRKSAKLKQQLRAAVEATLIEHNSAVAAAALSAAYSKLIETLEDSEKLHGKTQPQQQPAGRIERESLQLQQQQQFHDKHCQRRRHGRDQVANLVGAETWQPILTEEDFERKLPVLREGSKIDAREERKEERHQSGRKKAIGVVCEFTDRHRRSEKDANNSVNRRIGSEKKDTSTSCLHEQESCSGSFGKLHNAMRSSGSTALIKLSNSNMGSEGEECAEHWGHHEQLHGLQQRRRQCSLGLVKAEPDGKFFFEKDTPEDLFKQHSSATKSEVERSAAAALLNSEYTLVGAEENVASFSSVSTTATNQVLHKCTVEFPVISAISTAGKANESKAASTADATKIGKVNVPPLRLGALQRRCAAAAEAASSLAFCEQHPGLGKWAGNGSSSNTSTTADSSRGTASSGPRAGRSGKGRDEIENPSSPLISYRDLLLTDAMLPEKNMPVPRTRARLDLYQGLGECRERVSVPEISAVASVVDREGTEKNPGRALTNADELLAGAEKRAASSKNSILAELGGGEAARAGQDGRSLEALIEGGSERVSNETSAAVRKTAECKRKPSVPEEGETGTSSAARKDFIGRTWIGGAAEDPGHTSAGTAQISDDFYKTTAVTAKKLESIRLTESPRQKSSNNVLNSATTENAVVPVQIVSATTVAASAKSTPLDIKGKNQEDAVDTMQIKDAFHKTEILKAKELVGALAKKRANRKSVGVVDSATANSAAALVRVASQTTTPASVYSKRIETGKDELQEKSAIAGGVTVHVPATNRGKSRVYGLQRKKVAELLGAAATEKLFKPCTVANLSADSSVQKGAGTTELEAKQLLTSAGASAPKNFLATQKTADPPAAGKVGECAPSAEEVACPLAGAVSAASITGLSSIEAVPTLAFKKRTQSKGKNQQGTTQPRFTLTCRARTTVTGPPATIPATASAALSSADAPAAVSFTDADTSNSLAASSAVAPSAISSTAAPNATAADAARPMRQGKTGEVVAPEQTGGVLMHGLQAEKPAVIAREGCKWNKTERSPKNTSSVKAANARGSEGRDSSIEACVKGRKKTSELKRVPSVQKKVELQCSWKAVDASLAGKNCHPSASSGFPSSSAAGTFAKCGAPSTEAALVASVSAACRQITLQRDAIPGSLLAANEDARGAHAAAESAGACGVHVKEGRVDLRRQQPKPPFLWKTATPAFSCNSSGCRQVRGTEKNNPAAAVTMQNARDGKEEDAQKSRMRLKQEEKQKDVCLLANQEKTVISNSEREASQEIMSTITRDLWDSNAFPPISASYTWNGRAIFAGPDTDTHVVAEHAGRAAEETVAAADTTTRGRVKGGKILGAKSPGGGRTGGRAGEKNKSSLKAATREAVGGKATEENSKRGGGSKIEQQEHGQTAATEWAAVSISEASCQRRRSYMVDLTGSASFAESVSRSSLLCVAASPFASAAGESSAAPGTCVHCAFPDAAPVYLLEHGDSAADSCVRGNDVSAIDACSSEALVGHGRRRGKSVLNRYIDASVGAPGAVAEKESRRGSKDIRKQGEVVFYKSSEDRNEAEKGPLVKSRGANMETWVHRDRVNLEGGGLHKGQQEHKKKQQEKAMLTGTVLPKQTNKQAQESRQPKLLQGVKRKNDFSKLPGRLSRRQQRQAQRQSCENKQLHSSQINDRESKNQKENFRRGQGDLLEKRNNCRNNSTKKSSSRGTSRSRREWEALEEAIAVAAAAEADAAAAEAEQEGTGIWTKIPTAAYLNNVNEVEDTEISEQYMLQYMLLQQQRRQQLQQHGVRGGNVAATKHTTVFSAAAAADSDFVGDPDDSNHDSWFFTEMEDDSEGDEEVDMREVDLKLEKGKKHKQQQKGQGDPGKKEGHGKHAMSQQQKRKKQRKSLLSAAATIRSVVTRVKFAAETTAAAADRGVQEGADDETQDEEDTEKEDFGCGALSTAVAVEAYKILQSSTNVLLPPRLLLHEPAGKKQPHAVEAAVYVSDVVYSKALRRQRQQQAQQQQHKREKASSAVALDGGVSATEEGQRRGSVISAALESRIATKSDFAPRQEEEAHGGGKTTAGGLTSCAYVLFWPTAVEHIKPFLVAGVQQEIYAKECAAKEEHKEHSMGWTLAGPVACTLSSHYKQTQVRLFCPPCAASVSLTCRSILLFEEERRAGKDVDGRRCKTLFLRLL